MADVRTYNEQKYALKNQIQTHLGLVGENVDIYPVTYENIAMFPAVALQIENRRKPKKGVGVYQLEVTFYVWVYVNVMDGEDAELEVLRLMEIVEEAIESDKTLGGTCHYLDIGDSAELGLIENEGNFIQGARIQVNTTKRVARGNM